MCIICLEFNKHKDLMDASRMIEAARREADAISPEHLKKVEEEINKMKENGDTADLIPEDD